MPQFARIAGSFAIVLVAYWAYALVAVPLIEPPADPRSDARLTQEQREAAEQRLQWQVAELSELFRPGEWELNEPTVFESERLKLLFDEYEILGDGKILQLDHCSLVFMPEALDAGSPSAGGNAAPPKSSAVVLQAPDGATLHFDEELDLSAGKIGRLVGGHLNGRITIRSDGSREGIEDDLLLVTRDVELTERHIWTPSRVDFTWGPHYGRGQRMRIELLPGNPADRGPSVAGVRSFHVERIEQLHLELGETELATMIDGEAAEDAPAATAVAQLPARQPAAESPATDAATDMSVEVTCNGPFHFDVVGKVATFEDRVTVLRVNPNGSGDQLNCESLAIYFVDREEEQKQAGAEGAAPPAADVDRRRNPEERLAESFKLRPWRIEARGNPVVLNAPSEDVDARGQLLEYDLIEKRIVLDGNREVVLRQGANEIHARSLRYRSSGSRRALGQIVAAGPGWLRGEMAERPGEQLTAIWRGQLSVRPYRENQVISLYGGAELRFQEIGRLTAPAIHFYLLEIPKLDDPKQLELQPERMLACQENYVLEDRGGRLVACRDGRPLPEAEVATSPVRNVAIESPRLSASVEQLGIWFQLAPPALAPSALAPSTLGLPQATVVEDPSGVVTAGIWSSPARRLPRVNDPRAQVPERQQHFDVAGRLLQASVLIGGTEEAELSELTIVEDVRFVETQTKLPDEKPLLLGGDRLQVAGASTPRATARVVGRPAHFQGRGMTLSGTNINLDRGANRLGIDGAGWMELPLEKDLQGRPLQTPGRLKIDWLSGMSFDGRTAQFEKSVTVAGPSQSLRTEHLAVQFQQPIDFADVDSRQDPDVGELFCRGGVFLENFSFEGQKQTSHDQIEVVDLTIDRVTGNLFAAGPGRLRSVRYGTAEMPGGFGGSSTANAGNEDNAAGADGDAGAEDERLQCVDVRFQGSITGNVHDRQMSFHDGVKTAFAPVDSWHVQLDADDPDSLGPKGVAMHCGRLTINEMPAADGKRTTLELEAAGNPVVEGNAFTARALRMSYNEVWDLLVLAGDGRTDAELFRQQRTGGPTSRFAARKIYYWPKSKRLKVVNGRSLEIGQFSVGKPEMR